MGYKKLVQYGKTVETYEYSQDYIPRRKKSGARKGGYSGSRTRNRREDNLFRLRRSFIRLVRANLDGVSPPKMVTLTMFETVSVGVAYRAFSGFVGRLRDRFGEGFSYIAVPEFQGDRDYQGRYKEGRGAVHFHVLFWGLSISSRTERRTRDYQRLWSEGFLDVVSTDGSPKLAGYIGKYLFKAMYDERLLSKKAYCASRNVKRPAILRSKAVFDVALAEIVGECSKVVRSSFQTSWLGTCQYSRYSLI